VSALSSSCDFNSMAEACSTCGPGTSEKGKSFEEQVLVRNRTFADTHPLAGSRPHATEQSGPSEGCRRGASREKHRTRGLSAQTLLTHHSHVFSQGASNHGAGLRGTPCCHRTRTPLKKFPDFIRCHARRRRQTVMGIVAKHSWSCGLHHWPCGRGHHTLMSEL